MLKVAYAALTIIALCVVATSAQTERLSSDAITRAINIGTAAKIKEQGLDLHDLRRSVGKWPGAGIPTSGSMGFRALVYTPTTWIQKHSAERAAKYQSMATADVTPDMLEPVLRIVVDPDLPWGLDAGSLKMASSVDHVVLQDKQRKVTLQPASIEPFDVPTANALGAARTFTGQSAKFPLASLKEVRGSKGNQEFYIVVIGQGGPEKLFEVKAKDFAQIP